MSLSFTDIHEIVGVPQLNKTVNLLPGPEAIEERRLKQ